MLTAIRRFFCLPEPTWRNLPRRLIVVAVEGALMGPLWNLGASYLIGFHRPTLAQLPLWLLFSAAIGALFATTFYVTCAVPQQHIDGLIGHYSKLVRSVIRYTLAILGAVLGVSLLSFVMGRLFHFEVLRESVSIFISAAIAVLITSLFGLAGELKRERELRIRIAAEAAARAQVAALQAQINPHFFFNTLNTLSALVGTNPDRARELIQSLAGMFRYSLACSQQTLVSLDDELRFIENYLVLEQARLAGRLEVRWLRFGDLSGVRLPGLALQPLIENAIRHGIARRLQPGTLEIELARLDASCRIVVRNQSEPAEGPPDLRPEALWREGHALSIVRQRLATQYGAQATLTLSNREDWVIAELRLPCAALRQEVHA